MQAGCCCSTALCWNACHESGVAYIELEGRTCGCGCEQVRVRAAVQLLLVQACGEIYGAHRAAMPPAALATMLQLLAAVAAHARGVDDDQHLRHAIALAQAEDQVRCTVEVLRTPPCGVCALSGKNSCARLFHSLAGPSVLSRRPNR